MGWCYLLLCPELVGDLLDTFHGGVVGGTRAPPPQVTHVLTHCYDLRSVVVTILPPVYYPDLPMLPVVVV